MKKIQTKKREFKPSNPVNANCIILFKDAIQNQNDIYDYEILLLQRQRKMTFGNMWSFPGGKEDQIDSVQCKEYQVSAHQQCAIRETYEESGILLLPKNVNIFQKENWLQLLISIAEKQKQYQNQDKNFDVFTFLQKEVNSMFSNKNSKVNKSENELDLQIDNNYGLFQIVRFLTPAVERLPKRFDTRFYGFHLQNSNYLNWNFFYNQLQQGRNYTQLLYHKSLLDTNYLQVSKGEVKNFSWFTPSSSLQQYLQEKIKLAYPQFHILNTLSSFQNIQDLIQQILFIENWSKINRFKYKNYEVEYNIQDFPFVPQFQQNTYLKQNQQNNGGNLQFVVVYPGDKNFDFKQYYQEEENYPQEHIQNFVKKYYGQENQDKWNNLYNQNQGKLFFKNLQNLSNINHNYQSQFKYNYPTLLNFMNSQENLENLILKPKL